MAGKQLEGEWLGWLMENLERKCDPEPLLDTLLKNNFDIRSVRHHMGLLFPAGSPILAKYGVALPADDGTDFIDYSSIAKPRLTRPDSGVHAQQYLSSQLQLYTIDQFMSDEECDRVAQIASSHLRPSTVTTGPDYAGYRTSTTSDLGLLNDTYINTIDEKIARTLGIQLPYSEGIQAQRYDIGQEFKEHTDYFKEASYEKYAGTRGQRTWTFMVYLNNVPRGGGTRFHTIGKTFLPRKGLAVIWNNLRPDGTTNPATLHSGEPVLEGFKIIITKWFRERGFGPQFY